MNIGGNKRAYWPVHFTSTVINPRNIILGVETYPGLMGGCYIQGIGKVFIGDYTLLAANTCIISAHTDPHDARKYFPKDVRIGKYCWIGAGAIILPGVELGDFTIVGAGAVVTNSFPEGYCVIAGNPAAKIKDIEKSKCIPYKNANEYIGYIRSDKFKANVKKYINLA
ncbi:MAG: acyltransferase [Chitinophagaceae bacterium]|nr:acyltransferase [Chitinophagaceae bacterium]